MFGSRTARPYYIDKDIDYEGKNILETPARMKESLSQYYQAYMHNRSRSLDLVILDFGAWDYQFYSMEYGEDAVSNPATPR